jgi:prepilin-type N-terminal cleavage/methylation domain-containing protein
MNTKRAFTLIELLVVIAIIAILAAILFPVFAQAKAAAKAIAGLSNLKQLALASQMYYNDNDDTREGRQMTNSTQCLDFRQIIYPYTKSIGIFQDTANPAGKYVDAFSDPATRKILCGFSSLNGAPITYRSYYFNNIYGPRAGSDLYDNAGLSLSSVTSVATTGDVVEGKLFFSDIGPFSQAWVDNVDNDTSWFGAGITPSTGMTGGNLAAKYNNQAQNVGYMDGHAKRTSYVSECSSFSNIGVDAANCGPADLTCTNPNPVWNAANAGVENFWNFDENDLGSGAATANGPAEPFCV